MTSNPPIDDGQSVIPGVPHRWTPLTIALTIILAIVFWPLGLAMVAYVLFGEKILAATRGSNGAFASARRSAEDFARNIREEFRPRGAASGATYGTSASRRTGNAEFDAWREAELRRIEEERRKLEETTAAFEAHLAAERGAYDATRQREEFERFMHGRG